MEISEIIITLIFVTAVSDSVPVSQVKSEDLVSDDETCSSLIS